MGNQLRGDAIWGSDMGCSSRCGCREPEEKYVAELPLDEESLPDSPTYMAPAAGPTTPLSPTFHAPPLEIRGPTVYDLEIAEKVEEISEQIVTML